jgi:hypothetical protein
VGQSLAIQFVASGTLPPIGRGNLAIEYVADGGYLAAWPRDFRENAADLCIMLKRPCRAEASAWADMEGKEDNRFDNKAISDHATAPNLAMHAEE